MKPARPSVLAVSVAILLAGRGDGAGRTPLPAGAPPDASAPVAPDAMPAAPAAPAGPGAPADAAAVAEAGAPPPAGGCVGDWRAGDYPPELAQESYLTIGGVPGQQGLARQYKVHLPRATTAACRRRWSSACTGSCRRRSASA